MRMLDRTVAGLLAAVVAALGFVTVVEIVYSAVGDGPYLLVDWPTATAALAGNTWSDTGPTVFGAVTAAVGVLLCAVAFRRGRYSRLATRPLTALDRAASPTAASPTTAAQSTAARTTAAPTGSDGPTVTFVRRRGLAKTLRHTAESVDGVMSARVRFGRREVKVRLALRPRTSAGAAEAVGTAVSRQLASFGLVRTPPLVVRTSPKQDEPPGQPAPADPAPTDPAPPDPGPPDPGPTDADTVADPDTGPRRGGGGRQARRPFVARVVRLDRALLALFGLVAVAGGTVVLLAGRGVLGTKTADSPVLTASTRSFAADHGWFWPVVGVGAAIVTLAALAWLAAQLTTGRLRHLAVTDDEIGTAYVDGTGVARAVADDAGRNDAVRRARATLLGTSADPLVRLVLTMEPDGDAAATRRFAESEVMGRARQALARPSLRGQVELEPTDQPARRAR